MEVHNIQSLLDQGAGLQRAGDLDGAGHVYLDILEADPCNAAALHQLGVIAFQRGSVGEAVERIHEAITTGPAEAAWYCNLGVALLHQGRLDEAAEAFEEALGKDPGGADALANLGTVRQEQGRHEEAMDCLGHARDIAPLRPDLHYNLANAYAADCRWPEAEASYLRAIDLDPDNPLFHYNLGIARHHQGNIENACRAYRRALELDTRNVEALTNLGTLLRETGRTDEATECFKAACAIRPDDPTLQRNLRGALNRQIPAWHWTMLADERRNQAFRQAIERAVNNETVALDIGTGSGLLAMMVARAGARQVIACEISPILAEAARNAVEANELADRVRVVNLKSTAMRVGDDLDTPATLLVSEIVDVGLLGEGILPTLRHALTQLAAPNARVIPRGATVYARLVELPDLRRVNPVRHISGFDLSAFDRFRIPGDYLDVRLERTPHRFLSDTFEVAHFDFTEPPPYRSEQAPHAVDIAVDATAAGALHAVAFWFDLHLDETVTLSNAPGAGLIAWGQAVQFLEEDLDIAPGENLCLRASISDTQIGFLAKRGAIGIRGEIE